MDLCAIGARIQAAREKAGMTQEDLAAVPEMSPTHISVTERGVKSPKLETLVNIANALNVPSDMLLQDAVLHAADGIASELSVAISNLLKKTRANAQRHPGVNGIIRRELETALFLSLPQLLT